MSLIGKTIFADPPDLVKLGEAMATIGSRFT
jgi:hypothetical protein